MRSPNLTTRIRAGLPLAILLSTTVPGTVLTLHTLAILPVIMETVPLTTFQPLQGSAYVAPLSSDRFPPMQSPADAVHEDGRPVRFPPMPGWAVVATQGEGRFHLSEGAVYMSATDNSDPRTNGRTYSVVRPQLVPHRIVVGAWAVAALGTLVVMVWWRRPILRLLAHPPFAALAALLLVAEAANRAWLFIDYPLVGIAPDSGNYFAAAEQIGTGTWPNFGNRPPVYPLFLRAVFAIVDRAIFLEVCQTALAFIAALTLVYAAYRWKPALGFPAVAVMALYLFGFTTIEHESAMLSESVYASCLMLAFAALILGLRRGHPGWLGWGSTAMALAVLTRPAGMFLIVTYVLVALWLFRRRFSPRATVAFLIPFPLLLLSMSIYNHQVVGAFAPSTWGEANLAVATMLYWETDPSYPPEINKDIERIRAIISERHRVTNRDTTLLDRSWYPDDLHLIFVNSFYGPALDIAMGNNYETVGRQWIRRIAFDSIRKHPDYYAKFVTSMLYLYFTPAREYDFRAYLMNRAWLFYVDKRFSPERGNAFMVRLGKEFATGAPPPALIITNTDVNVPIDLDQRILIPPTRGWRVYHLTHMARRLLFQRWVWPICVFVGLAGSLLVLFFARLRHDGAFVVFIVTVSALGAALVVSLVEYSQPRYSYPMEWAYGMSAVLLPLLFIRSAPERRS